MTPRPRRILAEWAQAAYRLSQRRAARVIPVPMATLRYRSRRDRQDALRQRLRELAAAGHDSLAHGAPHALNRNFGLERFYYRGMAGREPVLITL